MELKNYNKDKYWLLKKNNFFIYFKGLYSVHQYIFELFFTAVIIANFKFYLFNLLLIT